MDHFAPAAGVGALLQPAPPIGGRVAEQVLRLVAAWTRCLLVLGMEQTQDECDVLSLGKREVGDHTAFIRLELYRSGQAKTKLLCLEAGPVLGEIGPVGFAGVVKSRAALQAERNSAPDDADATD